MGAVNWIREAPANWEEMRAFAAFHEASSQFVEWGFIKKEATSSQNGTTPANGDAVIEIVTPFEKNIDLLHGIIKDEELGDEWIKAQYLFAAVITGKKPAELKEDPFSSTLLTGAKIITFTKEEVLTHIEKKVKTTYKINTFRWIARAISKKCGSNFPGEWFHSFEYGKHIGNEQGQAELLTKMFNKSCRILTQTLREILSEDKSVSPEIPLSAASWQSEPTITSLQNEIRMLDNHIAYLSRSLEEEKQETNIQLGAGASSSILRLEKALKKALKDRDDAIFKLTGEKTTALGRVTEVEKERDTALARIKELEDVDIGPNYNPNPALEALAARITVVEAERDNAIETLAQVRFGKTTVENERDAALGRATQAETAKDQAIVARDEAIAGKNKAEAERDEANRTVTELRGRVTVLEASETTLTGKVSTLETSESNLKTRLSTLESSKTSQQTDIDLLKLQVREFQEVKDSLASIKAKKKELKIKLEKAVEMLQSLKADLEDIISSTTNSKSEASSSAPSSSKPSDELPEVNSLLLLLKSKFEEKNKEITLHKLSISKLKKLENVHEIRFKLKFDLNKFLNEKIKELDFAKELIEKVTAACEIRDFSKIDLFEYISGLVTDYKALKASCEAKQVDKSISVKLNGNIMALESIQKTLQPKK